MEVRHVVFGKTKHGMSLTLLLCSGIIGWRRACGTLEWSNKSAPFVQFVQLQETAFFEASRML
jgi:hypothetical protein